MIFFNNIDLNRHIKVIFLLLTFQNPCIKNGKASFQSSYKIFNLAGIANLKPFIYRMLLTFHINNCSIYIPSGTLIQNINTSHILQVD